MSLIKKVKIFFLSLIYFFYKELNNFINDTKNIVKLYFFVKSKKNLSFKRFIKSNTKVFKNFKSNKKKNLILVDAIMAHPGYICTQLIISKFLQKITGGELVILNRKNNALIRSVGTSYNIQNFLHLEKDSFMTRLINFIKLLSSLINISKLDTVKKIRLNNVKIGEIAYDHYVRYTGDVYIKTINFKFIYFFFEAIEYNKIISNIFNKNNYKGIVLSETQFIPSAIVFQNALSKKIKVYARYGGPKKIGIRVYDNLKQIYTWKQKFDLKDFNNIKKNLKQKSLIPVDYFTSYKTKIIRAKQKKWNRIENLNIDNSLLKYLEINNILSIIEITNQCPELEKLNKLSIELKNELCTRAKLLKDANDQNLDIDKKLLERERLGIKKYPEEVRDSISREIYTRIFVQSKLASDCLFGF